MRHKVQVHRLKNVIQPMYEMCCRVCFRCTYTKNIQTLTSCRNGARLLFKVKGTLLFKISLCSISQELAFLVGDQTKSVYLRLLQAFKSVAGNKQGNNTSSNEQENRKHYLWFGACKFSQSQTTLSQGQPITGKRGVEVSKPRGKKPFLKKLWHHQGGRSVCYGSESDRLGYASSTGNVRRTNVKECCRCWRKMIGDQRLKSEIKCLAGGRKIK